ncbi:MAG: ABC transporter permease subunit [Pontiellaceae bacterium]|jgi:oligopeptide transport system permease protein|nr:ABC transporter permease subunit [Pontiellaceae bacterium]
MSRRNKQQHGQSLWTDSWKQLRKNRAAIAGLIILTVLILASAAAPWLTPYTYEQQNLELGSSPPSAEHWLGTDTVGRDLFTRLLYGGRTSFLVGICATLVSLLIGVPYGAVSGYLGGRTDAFMMRLIDILYTMPFTILVIILMVVFGRNIFLLFGAIGAIQWLVMARIIRGQVLALRKQAFIEAAEALGASRRRIILRHIIPNVLGIIIVYTTLTIPHVMLMETFLSFLGLGIQPPMSSWGLLIRDGASVMETYPWLLISPAVIFSLTLFSMNFLGDGLRDALDPRFAKGK